MWLDSVFEAAGTQRLIGLFGPLLQAAENGKLLLIDEFDASLHPLVARFLIRLINDPRVSSKGAQLLLTSHNTTLMDLDILRRDEIWLVQLDDKHASSLLPLLRSSLTSLFPAAEVVTGDLFGSVGVGLALDAARKFG